MASPEPARAPIDSAPRTVWTRGKSCAELAHVIAGDQAIRASGDLTEACVDARAGLLVTKRVPPDAVVASATPIDFAPEGARRVVALVSGGPHSMLAARVAAWVASSLGREASLLSGFRVPDERDQAGEVVERIAEAVPTLETRVVEAWTGKQLLEEIDDDALLVFGAAGGSWIQRMFLGPGARLASGAPGGAVVVHDRPVAVFQSLQPPVYVSPLLRASDALLVSIHSTVPVVALGALVGVVRRAVMEAAPSGATVESVMEQPQSVTPTDPLSAVVELHHTTGIDPVPVCNEDGMLIGVVSALNQVSEGL